MDDLKSLGALLNTHGVTTAFELSQDGGRQVDVLIPVEGELRRLFSLASRPEGMFLFGFRTLFRLDPQGDTAGTVLRLVDRVLAQPDYVPNLSEFSLELYPYQTWLDDGTRRILAERTKAGWMQLTDVENEKLWETFTTRFSFHRTLSRSAGAAIREPTPSVTWSVTAVRTLYNTDVPKFRDIDLGSRKQLVQALVGSNISVDRLFALDLNHVGYSFVPNVIVDSCLDTWPVPLIPIHNYSLFVDPTFSVGLFAHPWEESICVFGDSLVQQLIRTPLACFGSVIRST